MSDRSSGAGLLEKKLEEWDAIWEFWSELLAKNQTWQIDVGSALQSKLTGRFTDKAQYVGRVPGLSRPEDKEVALMRRQRRVWLTYDPALDIAPDGKGDSNVNRPANPKREPTVNSKIEVSPIIVDTTSSFN